MVYAIMCELNTSKKDYSALFDKIKSLGPWMHYFGGVWFVNARSVNSAKDIFDLLIPYIDGESDYFYITRVQGTDNYGWLPQDAFTWFKDNPS